MGVTQETTYQRRVCVRTAILCVNSVQDLDQPTVPPAETQGDIQNIPFVMWCTKQFTEWYADYI